MCQLYSIKHRNKTYCFIFSLGNLRRNKKRGCARTNAVIRMNTSSVSTLLVAATYERCAYVNQCLVRLANHTSDSITGTSTSTPTTVARAAPECRPNNEIATATASSKKLDVPIIQAGAAILCGSFMRFANQ